jgi:hypothetical protein
VEDDDINRFLRGVLIGGVGVATGSAATMGKAAEAEPLVRTMVLLRPRTTKGMLSMR